jgi:hypothetical protein
LSAVSAWMRTARAASLSPAGSVPSRTNATPWSARYAATPATSPIALLQLGAVAIALLLAIPTRRSLADSRRRSRIVGARKGDAA